MIGAIFRALLAFVGSNLDDILVLTLFFADARYRRRDIVLGQLLGIGALTALAICGAQGLRLLPERFLPFLGLVPIFLGIRMLFARGDADDSDEIPDSTQNRAAFLVVMLVTMGNGGDNLALYIPLFASFSAVQTLCACAVFALLVLLWCFAAEKIAESPLVSRLLARFGRWIVPAVLILLGLTILFAR